MAGFDSFPTQENSSERDSKTKELLMQAMREFGFIEGVKLQSIRSQISQSPERLPELYGEYEQRALAEIEPVTEERRASELYIGLSVSKVLLYMEAGRRQDALEELFDSGIDKTKFLTEGQYALLMEINELLL